MLRSFIIAGLERMALARCGIRLALLAMLLVSAAGLMPGTAQSPWVAAALADDDGGDDAGDDDGDDGGVSGRNERISGDNARKRADRAAAKRRAVARKAAPARPVVVVLDLPETAQSEARRRGFTVLSDQTLEAVGLRVQRLRLPRRMSVVEARRVLGGLGATATDSNSVYRPQAREDECGDDCTADELTGWPRAQGFSCAAAPLIGIVETTVDTGNAALEGQAVEVVDIRPAGTRKSGSAHGTAIAALFAGAKASRAQGLLPEARIIAAVPYYRSSRGDDVAEAFDIVRAMDLLVRRNPHVINLSLTGPKNAVIERVVLQAIARGIPVAAAAGNAGARAAALYPAAYDPVIAVTAVSRSLKVYRRALRGAHIDFAAPGVEVPVIGRAGRLETRSGTSFAVPYVAAAMAMLRLRDPRAPVEAIASDLAQHARDLGKPGKDEIFGWGLLRATALCGQG